MRKEKESGQALLIIILVMVVALTVGLSFISRSITTLRTSREEASSQKALAAAEAGIEQVLKTNTPIPAGTTLAAPPGDTSTTYGTSVNQVLGTQVLVNGGNIVPRDEGADVWLISHNTDGTLNFTCPPSCPWSGNLTIYWGDTSGACNNAALEIIVVYDALSTKFKRYAYDPCSSRRSSNNFSLPTPGGVVSGKNFSNATSGPIPSPTPASGCADGTTEQDFGTTSGGKRVHSCAGAVTYASAGSLCAAGWHVGDVVNDAGLKAILDTTSSTTSIPIAIYLNGDPGSVTGSASPGPGACFGTPLNVACSPTGPNSLRPEHAIPGPCGQLYLNGVEVLSENGCVADGSVSQWGAMCVEDTVSIGLSIANGFVIRVVPLYASSSIGVNVTSGPALPSQGIVIDSTGDSGGTKRKINVFKGYPQLPVQYFSYGLFSP